MATYALKGVITATAGSKVAKRDAIYDKIATFLVGKSVWGNTLMSKGSDEETGNPNMVVLVRFTQRPDLNNLFNLAMAELNKLTGVTASVSIHPCYHGDDNRSCVVEELATIVR